MQSHTRSIFDVFDGKRRYAIPLFQRQYVWDRERQWEPLWDDIREQAESEHEQRARPPHFLGAIVISQQRTFGDAVQAFDVIDGQQRLTTFQILLAAFRDASRAAGVERYDDDFKSYTGNKGSMKDPTVERYKLWPTEADVPTFRDVVDAGSQKKLEETYPPVWKRKKLEPRPKIVEAYLYFHGVIANWLAEDSPGDRARSLFEALRKRLKLVSIELEEQDDPQVIFETLNARGEPLLPSDLLRNFVLLRCSRTNEDQGQLYRKYWLPFDVDEASGAGKPSFWKTDERQGRLKRPRLDLFLQHFLVYRTKQDVSPGHLFQQYRSWIVAQEPYTSVEAQLQDLVAHAALFRRLVSPDTSTRLGVFAERLQTLDTSTVYPLLLWLLKKDLPAAELDGILVDLESYLVRRAICVEKTKNYNRFFLQLQIEGDKLPALTRAAFQNLLLTQQIEGMWPSDDKFKKAWLRSPAYTLLRSKRCEMILRALDDAQRDKKTEKIVIQSALTIEHVMPQSWQEHWPAPPADDDDALDRREALVQSLGNLTLLTQELNTSVSNGPFDKKRAEIAQQSALRLNAWFQTATTWDEEAIVARGTALFDLALTLWPRPPDPVASTVTPSTAAP